MSTRTSFLLACTTFVALGLSATSASAALPGFTKQNFPIGFPGSNHVDLGDVDSDGDLDFVFTQPGAPVYLVRNDGYPAVTTIWNSAAGRQWTDAALGDVNGDGFLDLAATSANGGNDLTEVWLWNPMTNTYDLEATYAGGNAVTFGELDGDGIVDFIWADKSNVVQVRTGALAGTVPAYDYAFGVPVTALGTGNFNSAGNDDLYVGTDGGNFTALENTNPGWTIALEVIPAQTNLDLAVVSNWKGPGQDDALFFFDAQVSYYDNAGGVTTVDDAGFIDDCTGMAAGDLSGDGLADLAYLCEGNALRLVENGGETADYAVSQGYYLDVGDIDNDGDVDIVVGEDFTTTVYLNDLMGGTETCNGIDDDLNGEVDDPALGLPPCGAMEECHWGACFSTCTMSSECNSGTEPICYVDDGRCDDDTDPCASLDCSATGKVCYSGACFAECSSDAMCDPANERCYSSETCRDKDDPCADVQCPAEQICVGGGCFYACVEDADCDMYNPSHFCFDGRCAATACEGIDCPIDEVCHGGTCFVSCDQDDQCDPASEKCYDAERCATDACAGVQCGSTQVCYGGTCFDDCSMASCMTAGDACYANTSCRDEDDPCAGVECGTTQTCHGGTCFDTCTDDDECDPQSICFQNRCTDPVDPWCSGYQCPDGESCYRADCFPGCLDDGDCAMDETCHAGACVKKDCTSVTCETDETCVMGIGACLTECTDDSECDTGIGEQCFDGICGRNACEAYDQAAIDAYHDSHPFTLAGRRLNLTQYSTPWLWPRPVVGGPGTSFEDWAAAPSVDPFGLRSARIVFYLDETRADGDNPEGKYALWITQGRASASQGASEGTYSIRIKNWEDAPDILFNPNDEAAYRIEEDDVVHVQATLTNPAGGQTSLGIGSVGSSERNWEIQLFGSFGGDLEFWEVYNAETGDTYFLDAREPVVINNPEFPNPADPTQKILADSGTPCDRTADQGICAQGTYSICRSGELLCDQTVFPWAFEICDGRDNTCSGTVDDPPIHYPIVYSRQTALSGWNWLPTLDSTSAVSDYMDYTPRGGDDRQGSTAIKDVTGGGLQAADRVWTLAHRDLTTGLISVPLVHGALVNDAATANSIGEQDRQMRLWSPSGHNFDEFFVAWYDDRYEGGGQNDKIPDAFDLPSGGGGDFRIVQKLTKYDTGSDKLESDAAVVRPVWLEGQTARDTRFNVRYLGDGDDEDPEDFDDDPYGWFLHLPRIGDTEWERPKSGRIKVEARTGDEALCMSQNPSPGNCYISTYTCTPGGAQCQVGEDAFCGGAACGDSDGDGFGGFDPSLCPGGEDCNDGDPDIHPGAYEICNGIDDDCDGRVDLASNPGNMYGNCPDGDESCGPWGGSDSQNECGGLPICVCPDGPEDPADPPSEPCVCREALAP